MNQPAFPAMHFDLAENEHGLTMRDYFAAQVVSHVLEYCGTINGAAQEAYKVADAMLKAREA